MNVNYYITLFKIITFIIYKFSLFINKMSNVMEFRFCLVGAERVGKKSIIKRFKALNATKTVDKSGKYT